VKAADIDLNVRALSMGKLHHAMMGTAAVAIGTAAAIPGTLVNLAAGGGERNSRGLRSPFRHPARSVPQAAPGEWAVAVRRQHEPQRAGADGRLGPRAGRSCAWA
jgi:2-methylaconitate isomerase